LLIEKSSQKYLEKNQQWLDSALEAGVRFFITALGNPSRVVKRVEGSRAHVFHDVTEKFWAEKAIDAGLHGLICVNNRAGGHAGNQYPERLFQDLKGFGVPLICAGGIGDAAHFRQALSLGYQGV
jgi:nitronate monooxygenase